MVEGARDAGFRVWVAGCRVCGALVLCRDKQRGAEGRRACQKRRKREGGRGVFPSLFFSPPLQTFFLSWVSKRKRPTTGPARAPLPMRCRKNMHYLLALRWTRGGDHHSRRDHLASRRTRTTAGCCRRQRRRRRRPRACSPKARRRLGRNNALRLRPTARDTEPPCLRGTDRDGEPEQRWCGSTHHHHHHHHAAGGGGEGAARRSGDPRRR